MRCARKGSLVGSFVGTESVTCEISMGTRMKGGGLLSSAANPWKYFNHQLTSDFWNGVETSDDNRLLVKAWVGANIKG